MRASKALARLVIIGALGLVAGAATVSAQIAMPDMKQMSGIPRPVTDLPDGTIAVRVIRGSLSNNIANQPVELQANGKTITAKTDDSGHAMFSGVAPGTTVKFATTVDGERLESQEFPVPAQGGIRLMLVATDKEAEKEKAAEAAAPPVTGQVVLGGQSRIVIEPADEAVNLYYLLEITNTARVRVTSPFAFDMPAECVGTQMMEGSSPNATVSGTHVRVQGPFPSGATLVQVACELPSFGASLQITQKFPANLEQVAVIAKKVGDMRLSSAQVANQQDMSDQGEVYIAAQGPAVPAGQPLTLTLDGLPHHSTAPRWTALSLAILIIVVGVWMTTRPEDRSARLVERKRLLARRDKLFGDLVRLETERRNGRGDASRYAARREELIAQLEHVYGALDTDDAGPEPADRAGLAA